MQKQKIAASYQKFHVIAHDLDETENLKAECKAQLGEGVRLADWNDIVAYVEAGGSIEDFIAALKIPLEYIKPEDMDPIPNTSYRISMNGELHWSGDRHYFFARHDHKLRGDFLAHSDIDNYRLSLGSWFGKGGFALCYGDPDSTVAPPDPEIIVSDEMDNDSIPVSEPDTTEPILAHVVSYQKFHIFAHNLSERGDLKAACKEKLGVGVRLADWNDIVAYVESGGSVEKFITDLGIPLEYVKPEDMDPIPNTSYRISMNGELHWSGDRHYFFARHDHKLRGDFLPHSDIDDYHLTLGSWFGTGGYVLCYGDLNGTVAPPDPEIKEPVQTSGG
jgi:hypothetical protein